MLSIAANEPLDWTDKGIAWPSDVKEKFHQGPFHNETMTKYTTNDIEIDITGEDFIVWMRTAGLPNFMKLRSPPHAHSHTLPPFSPSHHLEKAEG